MAPRAEAVLEGGVGRNVLEKAPPALFGICITWRQAWIGATAGKIAKRRRTEECIRQLKLFDAGQALRVGWRDLSVIANRTCSLRFQVGLAAVEHQNGVESRR